MNTSEHAQKKRRTIWLLSFLVLGMFGLGFALVPLYNALCQAVGIQSINIQDTGSSNAQFGIDQIKVDNSRIITIKFDASVHPDLPWDFQPVDHILRIHPGRLYQVNFSAHNRSNESITGQAIPSIAPWQATAFLHKLECFCFSQQTLAGNESVEMPLKFRISQDLPKEINSLTLSYNFMRLTQEPSDIDKQNKAHSLFQR